MYGTDNKKYRIEQIIKSNVEDMISFDSPTPKIDVESLYDSLISLRMQQQYIIGKGVSNTKPHYNSYVKTIVKDLNQWMLDVMQLLEVLILELKVRSIHNEFEETKETEE